MGRRINPFSGKQARSTLSQITPTALNRMELPELRNLAKAAQNELRADRNRFKKAGLQGFDFAYQNLRETLTPHDYTYSYYSIKERKNIEVTRHINPAIRIMGRITEKRNRNELVDYLLAVGKYFSPSTKTNTVEGIREHIKYLQFYMGGGDWKFDENGERIGFIPENKYTTDEIKQFYKIYDAAYHRLGSDYFLRKYEYLRDAIMYSYENAGQNGVPNLWKMTPEEAAEWLANNKEYVMDPMGVVSRDTVGSGDTSLSDDAF